MFVGGEIIIMHVHLPHFPFKYMYTYISLNKKLWFEKLSSKKGTLHVTSAAIDLYPVYHLGITPKNYTEQICC